MGLSTNICRFCVQVVSQEMDMEKKFELQMACELCNELSRSKDLEKRMLDLNPKLHDSIFKEKNEVEGTLVISDQLTGQTNGQRENGPKVKRVVGYWCGSIEIQKQFVEFKNELESDPEDEVPDLGDVVEEITAKFDVEKFDGSNDFGLWRVKMWCLLIQHGWEAALDPFPKTMADAEKTATLKTDVYKKAHSALLLCLDNKVLREVNKEDDSLRRCVGVDIDDEDQALMLLTSLPSSYDNFVETLFYGRESLTLEDVLFTSLNSPRVKKETDGKGYGDGLYGNYVYSLDGWAESGEASVGIQEKESLAQVWHKRLGHISEAGLHELEKREVLGNKGLGKLEFCENYVLGKSTRGPSRVESMSGCRYFLSIVDDYSRRVWVHFLRHKNEAFSKFKEWKQLVENQTGRKLKKLRTDNGLEFCNQEFNNLCKESGIARHLTVAGTPQQNGLAERMNRTLLNKVRCLLIQSGLPDSFWAEATVTAAYLINRSPSTALEKKTPMDLWSGHPANYEMLRIFGCVAYSHVNQGKLKPRAIKCIFLGYPDGVKGYRLWRLDDVKPKIIISRDVVFNESLMYKDTLKGAGAADSGKEVEFEVELQGSRVEPTVDPHTGENPGNEDEEQDEGPQQQNLDNYVLVRDRAKRTTTIPARYRNEGNVSLSRQSGSREDDMAAYAFAIAEEEDTHEPITFQEAINSSEKDEWVRAMEEEMSSLKKNHTWELVDQPPEGIDYNEVFSPVVRHTSIRVILSLTACEDYELEQLDVKTAFLHGNLEETIYMRQPPGFEEGTGNKVYLLKKSLYGLKHSQRQWYKRFDVYMTSNGFSHSNYDTCVYFKEFAPCNEHPDVIEVMSSPNHPTSNIEDAFSSNFLDYISASLDYSAASPGNNYSSSSNNSFGLVLIALPTLSLFHDDPYMKVMQAYYAKESPIPPPTIVPPSPMLSPMFNPQELFLHEELLPPKKRGRDRSSSSTFALPQEFEMGESSRKKSLERHEEQI
ncbi:retrotransposon protein, putative, ty1-copia subclass [Tanacetum coccineum]